MVKTDNFLTAKSDELNYSGGSSHCILISIPLTNSIMYLK